MKKEDRLILKDKVLDVALEIYIARTSPEEIWPKEADCVDAAIDLLLSVEKKVDEKFE